MRVALNGEEIWCPSHAAFSFLGPRGRTHHLKVGPFSKKGNRKQSGRYLALHIGRNSRGPKVSAIPPNFPWAILWRVTPFNLAGGEAEYAQLIEWIKEKPPLPPRDDHRLSVPPSCL